MRRHLHNATQSVPILVPIPVSIPTMSNSNSYHHPTNSSSARSVLRRSRYTTGGSTSVTSAPERSRILLDHNGFPVETVPAPQEHSSSTHNADSNANPSSSSSYVSNSAVSTADEILKRVQESRRRRAAAASSSSSQSVSGSVYSTASSSVNRNYHSNNHMNEVPPVTPNTLRTLEASRQKNKALAMEYGMALEASKARMVALERELEELNEFKNMEHDAFSASSQQYNDIQEKLKEAEQKYKDLHSELVRMQNSHQVQQHSLSSTLELAKSQSEDDHQRIIYLEKQVNSLQEDLRTVSMENDSTKFVKLSVTEHQEILSVLKANTERITTLESQNRSLQSQNTHLQKQNEESLAEFQSTLKDLEKFHSNVHHENDSSLKNGQEKIDMLNNKIDKQLEEINRKDKTIKDLERKMMQQENIVDEADRLRKELSTARDDLADVESRSKTRINFYENKLQTSQSTSDDAERKAREMNLRNKVLEVELREQKTNLLKRDEVISSLKAHLEEINQKHEDEMVKIRKDAEASENSKALLESYATKLELLTQNNKLLSAKEISLARCVKQRETEIADLEQKLAEVEVSTTDLSIKIVQ